MIVWKEYKCWKNIEELEEQLSQEELFAMLNTMYEMNGNEHEFLASLQGIDLKHEQYKSKYKEMQKRADARRQGLSLDEDDDEGGVDIFNAESVGLDSLGIEIEVEGE